MNFAIEKIKAVLFDNTEIELNTDISEDFHGIRIFVTTSEDVEIKEFVIYRGKHGFDKKSQYYGDGYSKLSQYGGKLNRIKNIGSYSDKSHYKMPTKEGFHTSYNYAYIQNGLDCFLIGAVSCFKFRTEIRINEQDIEIVQCAENTKFRKGEKTELERMFFRQNKDKKILFDEFADMLEKKSS